MTWVAVGVGAIGLIGGIAEGNAQQSAAKQNAELEAKTQKELLAQQRQYQLQDRQYRQNAVGAWAKFLDPKLIGGNSVAPATMGSGDAPSPTAPAKNLATIDANGMPITDPNNPLFAPNPTAAPSNALPMNHPAMFQGMSPQSTSAWTFASQYPNYNFFDPDPAYAQQQQIAASRP